MADWVRAPIAMMIKREVYSSIAGTDTHLCRVVAVVGRLLIIIKYDLIPVPFGELPPRQMD